MYSVYCLLACLLTATDLFNDVYLRHTAVLLVTVLCVLYAVMMHSQKILLVTADDFGYDSDRNRGILELFQESAVTRASVLVNGVACTEAFALANMHNIPLGNQTVISH